MRVRARACVHVRVFMYVFVSESVCAYVYVFVCESVCAYVYYLCERKSDRALTPNILLLPDDPPAQGSCDTEQLFTCMHLCGFTAAYDEVCVCVCVCVCVNMHTHTHIYTNTQTFTHNTYAYTHIHIYFTGAYDEVCVCVRV